MESLDKKHSTKIRGESKRKCELQQMNSTISQMNKIYTMKG